MTLERLRKENHMIIEKRTAMNAGVIPFMAAFPYAIKYDEVELENPSYDAATQLTMFAGRNSSRCT
jgi:hypothetical protein